jgi:hypothetical protein
MTRRNSPLFEWRADLLAMALSLALVACRDAGDATSLRATVRDSAGVEIVEIRGDPWTAPEWARVDTPAVVRIAPDNSRPETLFGRLRGALRLDDGHIVTLDAASNEIRVFDTTGALISRRGRRGQGPGELESPWRLVRARGDSIAIADLTGYIEVFSLKNQGTRRVRLTELGAMSTPQVLDNFPDGGFLLINNGFGGQPHPGRNTLTSTLSRMSATGDSLVPLGEHRDTYMVFAQQGNSVEQIETLFWAEPGMGGLSTGYVWCVQEEFRCDIRTLDGHLARSVRARVPVHTVTDADVLELLALRLRGARTPSDSATMTARIAQADRFPRFPMLQLIRVDSRDRIWVHPFTWRSAGATVTWIVFASNGTLLGTIALPSRLQVFDIGDDYVLGGEQDADDAQGVVLYRFTVLQR